MANIFDLNCRVEKIATGIKFYEQDILPCSYLFEGNLIIDMKIDYIHAGFGIVIAEDNGHEFRKAEDVYLFRTGYYDFSAIEKHLTSQSILVTNSNLLAPSITNTNIHLIFTLANNKVYFDWIYTNKDGQEQKLNLGQVSLKRELNKYRVGFYSSAGNIIKTVSFLSGVAKNWHTSIKNVRGGRIAFFNDGFRIENCEYDAEIEQQNIKLTPGTYYVSYNKEKLNNKFDIECIIFPTATEYVESNFEDANKNLINPKDNSITITKDIPSVNIKFKGTSGIISDITIKDDPNSEFVETEDSVVSMDGSYMTVYLKELKEIHWLGMIKSTPEYNDYTKPCPYAIIETISHRTTLEECNIKLKQEYGFIYDVVHSNLSIYNSSYKNILRTVHIQLTDKDNDKINIFRNINAYIYELILTLKDDSQIDVLMQKTFKKYIPADINSPIIVTDKDFSYSFDLSSSYREVATNNKVLALYPTNYEIRIKNDAPYGEVDYKIYGIPKEAVINVNTNTIKEYASMYEQLDRYDYKINKNIVELDSQTKSKYKHIVIEYVSVKEFSYLFTNYERELFTDTQGNIKLEKEPLEIVNGIIIYGINKNTNVKDDCFYRVPSDKLINSIDYYAENYDILDGTDYTVDYKNKTIYINTVIRNKYDSFVIDYLKNDSYAINYVEEYNQYEVDIATDKEAVYINYNMREDGNIYEYITSEIRPDSNKYILLRKDTNS